MYGSAMLEWRRKAFDWPSGPLKVFGGDEPPNQISPCQRPWAVDCRLAPLDSATGMYYMRLTHLDYRADAQRGRKR